MTAARRLLVPMLQRCTKATSPQRAGHKVDIDRTVDFCRAALRVRRRHRSGKNAVPSERGSGRHTLDWGKSDCFRFFAYEVDAITARSGAKRATSWRTNLALRQSLCRAQVTQGSESRGRQFRRAVVPDHPATSTAIGLDAVPGPAKVRRSVTGEAPRPDCRPQQSCV